MSKKPKGSGYKRPSNQLHTVKALLFAQGFKCFSAMNPLGIVREEHEKRVRSHIVLSQTNILWCWKKELEHKSGQKYVHCAYCGRQKARCTVKNKPVADSIVELCLAKGIS